MLIQDGYDHRRLFLMVSSASNGSSKRPSKDAGESSVCTRRVSLFVTGQESSFVHQQGDSSDVGIERYWDVEGDKM